MTFERDASFEFASKRQLEDLFDNMAELLMLSGEPYGSPNTALYDPAERLRIYYPNEQGDIVDVEKYVLDLSGDSVREYCTDIAERLEIGDRVSLVFVPAHFKLHRPDTYFDKSPATCEFWIVKPPGSRLVEEAMYVSKEVKDGETTLDSDRFQIIQPNEAMTGASHRNDNIERFIKSYELHEQLGTNRLTVSEVADWKRIVEQAAHIASS